VPNRLVRSRGIAKETVLHVGEAAVGLLTWAFRDQRNQPSEGTRPRWRAH